MEDGRRPTIADVPGLIEGASSGAGLGHAFLRHVRADADPDPRRRRTSRDPKWDHDVIRDELEAHDPALLEKPILVAFNKMDLPAARRGLAGVPVVPAGDGDRRGRHLGRRRRWARWAAGRGVRAAAGRGGARGAAGAGGVVVHRLEAASDGFAVAHEDEAYRVSGSRIERLVAQTNFDNEESAERFQRELVRTGIDGALRKAGIRPGDPVRIGGTELEWDPPEDDR